MLNFAIRWRRRLGTQYWGMYGLVVVALAMAFAFSPFSPNQKFPLPTGMKYLTINGLIPIGVYALVWLAAALVTLYLIFERLHGWIGIAVITFLSALFGWFYIIGWFVDTYATHIPSRSYLPGCILVGFSVYIAGNLPGEVLLRDSKEL